ncbi:eae-like domain protein, partial [Escherichia coli]|nr:eae-like domain protein [Escherichia coli]
MIKDLVASGHALADDMTGAPSVLVRCLATQLEVQLVRANALAAENALARKAVQAFCDVVGDNTEVICEEVGRDGVLVILEAMKATGNMPATDAFLSEVRAQGVEMMR